MKNKIILAFIVINFFNQLSGFAADSINIAVVQEWDVFHPVTVQTSASESFMHFLFRDMIYRDENGQVHADLAVEVPNFKNKLIKIITQNNKQFILANWEIKKNAVWSDGKPIICNDWILGWKVGLSEKVAKTEINIYTKISKIENDAKNPKKCKVTYSDASWTYDRDLPPLLPSHLESEIFQNKNNKQGEYEQHSNYVSQPTKQGLYSGPYKISEIKIGSHFILTENAFFWGKKPTIKKIIVKHIPNTSTLRSYILSNEINSIASVGFSPDLALQFDQDKSLKNYKVHFKNAPLFQAIFFNNEDPILSNKNVRKALAWAINKKNITDTFLLGKLNPAETIMSEADPAFVHRKASYNVDKANRILDAEGWIKNASGIREKNGVRLEVVFKTSAGIKLYENIQLVICDDFKKIGVVCRIKNEPPRMLLSTTIPRGDFQIAMFGQNTYPDTSLKGLYSSLEIPYQKNNWTGGNIIRMKNEQLDKLLNKYDNEWDSKKRIQLIQKIENIIFDDAVIVPIYHRREAFLSPRLMSGIQSGLKGTAIVFPEFWKM